MAGRGGLAVAAAALMLPLSVGACSESADPEALSSPQPAAATSPPAAAGSPSRTSPPTAPRTARQAARRIRRAEHAIADPAVGGRALDLAAWTQQLAYREAARRPAWDPVVLAGLPDGLRRTVRDNLQARRAYADISHTVADTVPAWHVTEPPAAERLLGDYHAAARRYGVGWSYLAAINLVESAAGRIHGLSTAGAQGPMQFLPSTWATYGAGGDIRDPDDAIPAAARFLVAHGGRRPGGMADALFAYNNSTAYVRGVTLTAGVMARHPRAFLGYYHWRVYYRTTAGDVLLPTGYDEPHPVPVRNYLARPGHQ